MLTAHQDNSLQWTGHTAFPSYFLFFLSPAKQSTQSRSTRTKTAALTQVLSNKLSGPVFSSIKGDSKLCVGCLLVLQWLAAPGTQYGPWKYYQCYCSAALLSLASITDTAPSWHIQYLQLHDIPQDGCSTTALGCSLRKPYAHILVQVSRVFDAFILRIVNCKRGRLVGKACVF